MNIEDYIRRMMDDIHKKYGNHKIDVTVTVPPELFVYVESEVLDTWCHFPRSETKGVPSILQMYHFNGTATIKPKDKP